MVSSHSQPDAMGSSTTAAALLADSYFVALHPVFLRQSDRLGPARPEQLGGIGHQGSSMRNISMVCIIMAEVVSTPRPNRPFDAFSAAALRRLKR